MGCEQDEVWKMLRRVCCSPKDGHKEGPGMLRTVCCSPKDGHREGPEGVWAVHDRSKGSNPRAVPCDCSPGGTEKGEKAEELGGSTLISLPGRTDWI